MPRGGGRKVTHNNTHRFVFMRFRLWRDDDSLWLRFRTTRRKIQSIFFFPLLSRASLYRRRRSLFFLLRDDHPSLFLCAAERSRGRSGFPKRALRKRERERDKRMMWFPISPWREKREREDQHAWSLTQRWKRSAKKRGKKKRIDSQNITHIEERKRKRERERERECFLREKRDIFPPFSLSFLCLPRREERVEKQTDIFRITAWHWPHLALSLLLLHATMK